MAEAIRLEQLSLGWGSKAVLQNLEGSFREGSLTALVGPNGAGKSTLVKGLVGALKPLSGRIVRAPHLRHAVSVLPQSTELDAHFPITTFDVVAMGAWRSMGLWRSYTRQDRRRVLQALHQVGLADKADKLIGTLSGGQLQRALFARLIVRQAEVMILDEPFSAVDEPTKAILMSIILDWHRLGRTVIVVMHDLQMVREHFEESLLLAHGVVAWGKTSEVLTAQNLSRALERCAGGM